MLAAVKHLNLELEFPCPVQIDSASVRGPALKTRLPMRRTLSLIASLAICTYLISCSGTSNGSSGTPPPMTSSVTVAPATVSLNKGGSQTFTATVNGTMDESVFCEVGEATPKRSEYTDGFCSTGGE